MSFTAKRQRLCAWVRPLHIVSSSHNEQISTAPALHLSNHEVLTHFLSLKEENDSLQNLQTTRSLRSAAKAKALYPLKNDIEDTPLELGEETLDEEVAERRGVSDELVWVQDQASAD